jgi:hypothetical protein
MGATPEPTADAVAAQRPVEQIQQVAGDIFRDFIEPAAIQKWMKSSKAICYYGPSQQARNVQTRGLHDAAQTWGIPFHLIPLGAKGELAKLLVYDYILFITTLQLAPTVAPVLARRDGKIALIANYYQAPTGVTTPSMSAEDAAILDAHGDKIAVALTECSPYGAEQYCRGFLDNHGVPVMSFTWGINLVRHFPVEVRRMADLIFLGSYFEKTARIDDYFAEPLRRFSHTVLGAGWGGSPFDIVDGRLEDFDVIAPALYSGHAVCLNVHHPYEEGGFTLNERVFNTVACGGFQISDKAPRIRDFFADDEVVVADSPSDFLALIEHFVERPDERASFVAKARARVVAEHTYHHRLCDLLWYVLEGKTRYAHCSLLDA